VPDATADAAVLYRRYGFSPIPFYRGTKQPAVGKGVIGQYRQRRASVAQLKRWFAGGEHSIGLVTGAVSRLLVLDIDPRNGGDWSVRGLPMPPTPTVLTPDGRHAYFRHAGGLSTRIGALPGVDILGEKWQVLAPPSLHPNGTHYRWHDFLQLTDTELAVPPAWVLDLLHARATPPPARHGAAERLEQVNICLLAPASGLWQGDGLEALCRQEAVNVRCAQFMGLIKEVGDIGRTFTCVLPGHVDRNPSATLYHEVTTGRLKYRDWHRASGDEWYQLVDVYASQVSGVVRRLRGPEMVTWQLRLLVDAGVVAPYPVRARALPADAPVSVQRVYRGFVHLLACKWLYAAAAPTPYSWRFAAAWCGMHSMAQIGAAMTWLLKQGYVRRVGTHKHTALFLPGRPSRRMASSAR
jgi:hypothetical protein